ncbi:MAG: peptidase M61, partial [Asticcacaulis sp. 32-58-5]
MKKWVSAARFSTSVGLVFAAVVAQAALAQTAVPESNQAPYQAPYQASATPAIPAARDIAYPGMLKVLVDATDLDHRRWVVRQVVPVDKAGEMVLMTPLWLPGKHAPQRFADKIANVRFSAKGETLTWLRDPVAVNAFRFTVPDGVTEVVAEFEYLAPMTTAAGRVVQTDLMANFQWELASMYPAGYFTSRIPVQLTLKLPQGWAHASALEVESTGADNTVTFKPISYDNFIDSPMFAGKYYKQWDLTPKGKNPVRLNVFADKPEYMEAKPEVIDLHRKMVDQSIKLFKSEHYDHYDFLVHLSEELGDIGLEHHRSSENGHDIKYFTDWANAYIGRDLLAHEFTHSWDGKFRR